MLLAWLVNILALAFAAALGARATVDPAWAARLVRLQPSERPGGFAEFRATFGGLFAASHGAALVLSAKYLFDGEHIVGLAAIGAGLVLAAAWGGAAAGRCLSMWRDGTRTRFNIISAGVETALMAAIGAPWLVWFLSTAD